MRVAESLAASVLLRVPALTDVLVRTIYEQNPGYRLMTAVPADDLWQSCHDNIARVVQMVAGGAAGSGRSAIEDYFDAAHATGQRRAEQRMPLDDVLRSFRIGGRLVWEALIEQAREQGTDDADALLNVASQVWEIVDTISSEVAVAYHRTERRLLRADEQRRAALWEGLLHGRAKDPAFAFEAARILGVPVDGRYAVVTVDVRAEEHHTAALLERRLAAARIDSAWQVRASTLVGLLALRNVSLDTALDVLQRAVDAPAGLSGVVPGLSDADVAYRQATLARRAVPSDRSEVASLEDRLPEALLLSSPELAAQLVQVWLAPLLKVSAAERQVLLDTLETWVAAAGSVRRTAELAHCHRNTVINRLHRIHQITGRDLTGAAFQVDLALALRAARLFPPAQDT
ncbi:helix-turn-helix domain-containing protein [Streptomyces sp. RB6PN25]|uniref:Helix-turn-helix domain-containing protein n=1 Tax=Streptomyces humicola TaxID=2953240 RepID=A0ABT1PP32_9ACTN|nr:helix-turn-helix domain-containing protein [Streptomyces humicola]MCQ4079423.1 helix-turn-helix domain-containing protein [Streptomyces humicola]